MKKGHKNASGKDKKKIFKTNTRKSTTVLILFSHKATLDFNFNFKIYRMSKRREAKPVIITITKRNITQSNYIILNHTEESTS